MNWNELDQAVVALAKSGEEQRSGAERAGMLAAAEIALDMFNRSGGPGAPCACGQCIYAAIRRKAGA